jgi:chemotaxis protein CheD
MCSIIVGIGDCKVSNNPSAVLVTHALGSCIALLVYDPVARVAGLLHYMLPESSVDAREAEKRPFLFADTGIPLLLQNVFRIGAVQSRLIVTAVGGAQMLDHNGTFNIGQRNHLAMRKLLWKAGVITRKEEIGGTSPRTVRIDVATGRVQLRTSTEPERDLIVHLERSGESDGLQHTHRR